MEDTVKSKNPMKVKEKRMAFSQDNAPKKNTKHSGLIKNDTSQLSPSRSFEEGSPVKKLLNEATKIMKIGMEKDFALLERDNTLQNSNETIDNLRKNILHLQMEYEKLDQNFQREISYRTEIVQRMDATRELVESVVQCSNILAASVKQLEDDKFKIAELYESIFQNQKEIETKHAETERLIKEQDALVKTKMEEIKEFQNKLASQNTDAVSQLNKKLASASEKLKMTTDENEKLQKKIQEVQESSTKLQMLLEQQEKLNNLHRENLVTFKVNLKKLKIQRFRYQKLLKSKEEQFFAVVNKNKNLRKSLEKSELLYTECVSVNKVLESKNIEWKSKFDKHLEDDVRERQSWKVQKQEFINQLAGKESEIKDLKTQNENLTSKISELATNEGAKQLELEQVQNDLSKILSENLILKENVTQLKKENEDKAKTISEFELKRTVVDAGLNSQIDFYKSEAGKLQEIVKELESQMSDLQKRLTNEKTQKEKVVSESDNKLKQTVKESNQKITELEKLLENKTKKIQALESEKAQAVLDGKTILEKLEKELQLQKSKNSELNKNLEHVKCNYSDLKKQLEEAEKEISNKKGKLTELDSVNKALNQKQNELEKNIDCLKKEIDLEKKNFNDLTEKHKKSEKELSKMQKMSEENAALQTTTNDLRNHLEATEARLEGYKMVVKKLENERLEAKNNHLEEVSKLKLELSRLEGTMKKDKLRLGTLQISTDNVNTKEQEQPNLSAKEKQEELLSSQKLNIKENESNMEIIEKWHHMDTPFPGGKKFLSTPRKVYSSTPQPNFRTLTPVQKKRDPYEFDSDSSAERLDPDKVLKVFNRQKRECKKRCKAAK